MSLEILAAINGKGLKDGKFVFDASVDIFALGQVFNYIFCYNDNDYGEFNDEITSSHRAATCAPTCSPSIRMLIPCFRFVHPSRYGRHGSW